MADVEDPTVPPETADNIVDDTEEDENKVRTSHNPLTTFRALHPPEACSDTETHAPRRSCS